MNWRAGIEPGVTFAMIILCIWWLRFRFPYAWIAILALMIASHFREREGLQEIGFGWDNRGSAGLWMVLGLIATAILAIGLICHTIRQVSWQGACLSVLLYCAWGLVQQYILNGYFVNRFSSFLPQHTRAVPILAAVCFSLAHLPNWFLMTVTLAGGYVCARVYLQNRNLYFLGLAHGAIGFLIYLAVPDTISHHLYVGPKWFSM